MPSACRRFCVRPQVATPRCWRRAPDVGEVFEDLVRQHPALRDQLLTPEGELHRHLNVFLNDDDIRYLGKLDAKVGETDTLTLMPAVAGG